MSRRSTRHVRTRDTGASAPICCRSSSTPRTPRRSGPRPGSHPNASTVSSSRTSIRNEVRRRSRAWQPSDGGSEMQLITANATYSRPGRLILDETPRDHLRRKIPPTY
jgi:hypothetical protein